MKAAFIVLTFSLGLVVAGPDAWGGEHGRHGGGYYGDFPRYFTVEPYYPYNGFDGYFSPYNRYNPYYYYYRSRPTRYYLPWDRPAVDVRKDYQGDSIRFYARIPPVIYHQIPVPAKKLDPTPDFITRQEFLIDTAQHDSKLERQMAVEELANYPDIASAALLVYTLFNDTSVKVRIASSQSLARIGLAVAYEPLVRSTVQDMDPSARSASEMAAMKIRKKCKLPELDGEQFRKSRLGTRKLVFYLDDLRLGGVDVRRDAVRELARFKETRSVTALINMLINDSDAGVRSGAAESLGTIKDKMALPFLKASRDRDMEKSVRVQAGKALKKISS